MKWYEFEIYGFDPAKVQIQNANQCFAESNLKNVKKTQFFQSKIGKNISSMFHDVVFDIVICDGVVILLTIPEFNDVIDVLKSLKFNYLLISGKMSYYPIIIGGTIPVCEKILKQRNFELIQAYYYYRKIPILNLLLHPIKYIKPSSYFHYKYLVYRGNKD